MTYLPVAGKCFRHQEGGSGACPECLNKAEVSALRTRLSSALALIKVKDEALRGLIASKDGDFEPWNEARRALSAKLED